MPFSIPQMFSAFFFSSWDLEQNINETSQTNWNITFGFKLTNQVVRLYFRGNNFWLDRVKNMEPNLLGSNLYHVRDKLWLQANYSIA